MIKYLLSLIVCLHLLATETNAQLKDEIIRFSDGLPSDFVKELVLNDRGYLILATRRGLSQYDGYRFLDHADASANISSLTIKDDAIYYHDVYNGLCMLRNFYSVPKVIAANKYHDADPNNDHYDNIFVDSGGRIWCSDMNNVKYFTTRGGRNKTFLIDKNTDGGGRFTAFMEPVKGKVLIFTQKGIFTWSVKTNRLSKHQDAGLDYNFSAVALLNKDQVLLGTKQGGILKYNISDSEIETLPSLPGNEMVIGFEKMNLAGQSGLLLYSSGRIYLRDDDNKHTALFYQTKDQSINKVIVNHQTNITWVATNKGLIKLFYPYSSVRNLMLPGKDRKPGNMITDIVEHSNGNIYCCTNNNLVWIYNRSAGWQKLAIGDPDVRTESLHPVANDILISTNRGVYILKGNKISKLALGGNADRLAVKKCIVDRDSSLWILPSGQAPKVYSWPGLSLKSEMVINNKGFWENNVWNDIFCNDDGKVWLAGWTPKSFGIAIYDRSKRYFGEVSKLKANADQSLFVGDYYNRITKTRNGDILVSAYGGWNLLNLDGVIKKQLNTKKYEVANDRVEGIEEDNNGKIWFATEEGLHVYNNNTDKVIRISQIDGLPADDLIHGFRKLNNGNLALGFENGLSIVDVNMIVRSQLVNKLELCAMKINGKVININNTDIRLKEGETELELLFSSLTYIDKRKIIYRYRFSEEKEWNYLGNKPELSLRHLAPGNYNIRIEAGDNLENWQSKDLQVSLYLPAPFYKTQWFTLLIFVAIVLVIIYVYRYLLHQHKVEEQYKRKLKEAEMQALRSQMNPHFMFNTLNSINSFIIEHKTDEASEYLTTFSRLMRDILDNSKHTSIPLHKELQTLKLYLSLEATRLEHIFDYHIKVNKNISQETLKVPPLILQPFAENAIWHGLRNKKGKGLLEILISLEDENTLHIIIKDNGIGRKAAALFMVSQFKHKSYGVDITSSRLRLLSSESSIAIEDLYDKHHEPAGTAVHIYLNLDIKN
jgi:ligand-binding sensor domain-containing protein